METVWIISDTHFSHANILTFKNADGTFLRDFKDVNHMNEYMIEKWNNVVHPNDKVYHLGDVVMNKDHISIIGRCNGHKRLILGNHDHGDIKLYQPYFEAFYSLRLLDRMMFSHVPVHYDSIGKSIANVHGHVHGRKGLGPRYFDVSVEAINYTPISLEDLKVRVEKQIAGPIWNSGRCIL